ncbi:HAMP domain-containing sensor histidine kinase [Clostridioides difficile]
MKSIKNQSLSAQFRRTLFLIMITSVLASLITYAGVIMFFIRALNNNEIYGENYYEQQIPKIEKYIHKKNTTIISPSNAEDLNNLIHGDGLFYQVVDNDSNFIYGTYKKQVFKTKEELFSKLNTKIMDSGNFVKVVPVIDDSGKIEGAVLFVYQLKLTYANGNENGYWKDDRVIMIALLSPFIYIIGFTILFSRILAKNINRPLKLLMDSSQKIKEKNLDFEIDYYADNELGKLCSAFSEMKDELKKSLSAQWKIEQERVEMVEALAHDLKSPLSIVKVYSEALVDDTEISEEQRQYLEVIEANVEKSVSLVQQMQYTSELEKSCIQLQLTPVNLTQFLEQKVYYYELEARKKEISIILNIQSDIEEPVLIDIEKLERIFDNIVSNSLRYTPAGGEIKISAKAEKEYMSYEICDSGTGFSAKDMHKVFEKFYRGDEARQTEGGHSGLGLYIVKQLVEMLGGSIKIENAKCGGACVIFQHKIFDKREMED